MTRCKNFLIAGDINAEIKVYAIENFRGKYLLHSLIEDLTHLLKTIPTHSPRSFVK